MKSVAVIILNWNGKELLSQFLPSVVRHTPQDIANIYVADNGSNDDSVAFIRQNFPEVKLMEFDQNYGFSGGYNRAIAAIQEPYTVLLNSDVAVTSNWLEPLLEYMQQHHHVAACQPKICSYSQKEYFEYAGAAGGYIDKYGYPFCKGRIFNVVEKDIGQYNQHAYIFWASGACLFIRTHVYKDLGGLDELFFAHMEEIDLCWRIWARGYRIAYIPSSQVYHLGGATLNKTNPHKTFLNFRNNWFLLYKNIPQKLVRIFFIRFLLDIVAVLKFLLSFEFSNAMSVCKAHFAFLRTYRKLKPSRKLNLSYTTCFNIPTIYKHCIVYQFFFKKKKYYYQLPNINESL